MKSEVSATKKVSKSELVKNPILLKDIDVNPRIDPIKIIEISRQMCKVWAKGLNSSTHLQLAQNFMLLVMKNYWQSVYGETLEHKPMPEYNQNESVDCLDDEIVGVAELTGRAGAQLDVITAAYQLGNIYTAVLPSGIRSGNGVFYTPPVLTKKLIEMSNMAGVNWATAKVADPACGGGAFLAPVAIKMVEALKGKSELEILNHIETHLKGYEIDPFAAWLTQVFLEVSLKGILKKINRPMKRLVHICNTLEYTFGIKEKFDLVIGNPPYGKLTLTPEIREKYKESLHGHANLYGLFTHLALNITKPNGFVGYLTPTSFLSGEYFKNLRLFIRQSSTPIELSFVSVRKGVFEDVLQETMLSIYHKVKPEIRSVTVNEIETSYGETAKVNKSGINILPEDLSSPWLLSRRPGQKKLVQAMNKMNNRFKDWGYKINTGQLVWNRHKDQLTDEYIKGCYPIIWSESITSEGQFVLRSEKRNHSKWFRFESNNKHLLTTSPCVLLQRTTSKEQEKRLIAAVLPKHLIDLQKAVIVENHLNMIVPLTAKPLVSLEVLSVFLNSKIVNDAFRTISGSVAVSAYELEALPLPKPVALKKLLTLVTAREPLEVLEKECSNIYTL